MNNNKNSSQVLTCIGACYRIHHDAICQALQDHAPHLLPVYDPTNPIGSILITGNDGIEFIPNTKNSDIWAKMADAEFREKVDAICHIVLSCLPEFLMKDGAERNSYYENLAKFKDVIFALMVDIEALRGEGKVNSAFGNRFASEPIKDAARFIGVLSDEYGVRDQAIAFSEDGAVRFQLVSREEAGLDAKNIRAQNHDGETIH